LVGSTLSSAIFFPAGHEAQEVAPIEEEYFPKSQVTQTAIDVAASILLQVPTEQLMQAEEELDPTFELYLPGIQAVQIPPTPFSLYFPAAQFTQSDIEIDSTARVDLPTGQNSH